MRTRTRARDIARDLVDARAEIERLRAKMQELTDGLSVRFRSAGASVEFALYLNGKRASDWREVPDVG